MGEESYFSVEGLAQVEEIRNAIKVFNESHRVHPEPNYDHDPDYNKPKERSQKQSIAYAVSTKLSNFIILFTQILYSSFLFFALILQ